MFIIYVKKIQKNIHKFVKHCLVSFERKREKEIKLIIYASFCIIASLCIIY